MLAFPVFKPRLVLRQFALFAVLILAVHARPQTTPATQSQAQDQPDQSSTFTLKVNSDLVLTNVVVRDKKTGAVVKGLTEKDFTVTEDGKPQHIASFDFENVDEAAALNEATINAASPNGVFGAKAGTATPEELQIGRASCRERV